MNLKQFTNTEVKTQQEAMELLSEFLTTIFAADFPGINDSEICPECGEDPYYCNCESCDECDELPLFCHCDEKEDEEEEMDPEKYMEEAQSFADKWNIPFSPELHKSIIDGIANTPNGIWNSSSAYC